MCDNAIQSFGCVLFYFSTFDISICQFYQRNRQTFGIDNKKDVFSLILIDSIDVTLINVKLCSNSLITCSCVANVNSLRPSVFKCPRSKSTPRVSLSGPSLKYMYMFFFSTSRSLCSSSKSNTKQAHWFWRTWKPFGSLERRVITILSQIADDCTGFWSPYL